MDMSTAQGKIMLEYHNAREMFKPFSSAHEGFAVIQEEIDELWIEIKRNPRHHAAMEREAIQCGAMILRFLTDIA